MNSSFFFLFSLVTLADGAWHLHSRNAWRTIYSHITWDAVACLAWLLFPGNWTLHRRRRRSRNTPMVVSDWGLFMCAFEEKSMPSHATRNAATQNQLPNAVIHGEDKGKNIQRRSTEIQNGFTDPEWWALGEQGEWKIFFMSCHKFDYHLLTVDMCAVCIAQRSLVGMYICAVEAAMAQRHSHHAIAHAHRANVRSSSVAIYFF